jgi:tetratricopeptide (TPR) repeat protein
MRGLIEYNWLKNSEKAITTIKEAISEFEKTSSFGKLAGIYVNLAYMFFNCNDREQANEYILKALEVNRKIGNYEQQANIQMNQGVMLMDDYKFEEAIQLLKISKTLFHIQNNKYFEALCSLNLGEAFLNSCDYQQAYDSLSEAEEKFGLIENDAETLRVLFLLGKFWYFIGDDNELKKIINQFEYYSYTKLTFTDEHALSYEYLKIMLALLSNENIPIDKVLSLLERTNDDYLNLYGDLIFNFIEAICIEKRISDVLFLLKHPLFEILKSNNLIFDAYSDYINGLIVKYDKLEGMQSPIEYFESAVTKLESESISELTWKVLVATTEVYVERGNYHKAKKPRIYALELINLIADSINNPRIRFKFLEKKERKNALESLKKLNDKVKENEFQQS